MWRNHLEGWNLVNMNKLHRSSLDRLEVNPVTQWYRASDMDLEAFRECSPTRFHPGRTSERDGWTSRKFQEFRGISKALLTRVWSCSVSVTISGNEVSLNQVTDSSNSIFRFLSLPWIRKVIFPWFGKGTWLSPSSVEYLIINMRGSICLEQDIRVRRYVDEKQH